MELAVPGIQEEAALWERLRARGDLAARQRLCDLHMPYARVVAATYYGRRFHDEIAFEDYLQYASLGMLEAMDRFDPARGVQFRTFAARRMHGAILNGLEHFSEKQQQIAARRQLRLDRALEVKSLALAHTGQKDAVQEPQQLLRFVSEVGIGLALCWMLEGTGMVENEEQAASVPFYKSTALRQLRERLLQAVDTLPPQERVVIRSHYLQDVPFEQVAATLQLTKGRISQIHKQALQRLRALVREDADWSASF